MNFTLFVQDVLPSRIISQDFVSSRNEMKIDHNKQWSFPISTNFYQLVRHDVIDENSVLLFGSRPTTHHRIYVK